MKTPCGQEDCDCGHTIEKLVKALEECQRLATERIRTADAAVKKDIYAADALMGIAVTARDAIKEAKS
ncbi:hypothetical protein LCGC14_2996460 [marine sediment metagenome]|uniref:Uncharacterized protein n=1 Tax=marine sediment metagenome TaxID=412755 RepID=A0A0F8XPV7_9ZZZZ